MNTPIRLFARHFTLAVSLALAMVGGAAAQDAKAGAKVGAVNVERILRDSSTAKAVSAKLEQDFSKRERDLRASADQLRQAVEKFERESPTLPESQRTPRQMRVSSGIAPEEEKSGADAFRLERVQDFGRSARPWAVVEGEHQLLGFKRQRRREMLAPDARGDFGIHLHDTFGPQRLRVAWAGLSRRR